MKIFNYIKATLRKIRVLNKLYKLAQVAYKDGRIDEAGNLLNRYERISKTV